MPHQIKTSKNGLTIILSIQPNVKITTIVSSSRAGSRYETKEERGYAHLMEHTMLLGSKNYSQKDINSNLDLYGGYLNALTNQEFVKCTMQVLSENEEKLLPIFADLLENPIFNEKILNNEKKVVLEEIKLFEGKYREILWRNTLQKILPKNHPLTNHALGEVNTIKKASSDHLAKYHNRTMQPNQTVICIITPNKSGQKASEYILNNLWKNQKIETQKNNKITTKIKQAYIEMEIPTPQSQILINYATKRLEYKESLILHLISTYLGYGKTGALKDMLRSQKGLIYSLQTMTPSYQEMSCFAVATSSTKPKEVIEVITNKLESLSQSITDQEIEIAKTKLINSVSLSFVNPINECNVLLSEYQNYNIVQTNEERKEKIKKIKPEEIKEIASRLLKPQNRAIAIGKGKSD
ncbi:insulinase family protein [Candidatus Woesebacteria bacterium]|nr:insulinase family protein [Candidatus Woesebacteria bacterium]QQG47456.1 MAG: insulinase family protein [Candidatus Woesebacteria bacterium]